VNPLVPTLLDGLRLALLRSPRRSAPICGAGLFIALVAIYLAVSFGMARFDAGTAWRFAPTGVSTVLADALLTLVAAWLVCAFARRDGIVWGAAATLLGATIATALVIHWPLAWVTGALADHGHPFIALLIAFVSQLWWFLVLLVFVHWLAAGSFARILGVAVLAYLVSAAVWWWLPATAPIEARTAANEIVAANDNDGDDNSAPDDATAAPADDESRTSAPSFDAEEVMFNQPALLDAALAKLKPTQSGHPHLYVVAFAGDAGEDVFRNEAEYAERLFAQRFDADGRVLVLQNNAATVATRPLATWTNLHHALEAIAKKMDPAEDILLVYLTTHGSEDHQLLVDLDPLPLDQIEPEDLADALKTAPAIRWKVVVVNACYSGGFIDAVRDDSTMVIASARSDRTSFGCGADSDITYFGKAFLAEALNRTTSLREAFDLATRSVADWEAADKEEHSEPQIATSRSIEAKLERWQRGLAPAPSVPFAPAAAAEQATPTTPAD